jgi:hypothetical protein
MLMKRPSLMALAIASGLMAAAEAAQSTGSAGAAPAGEVPSTNAEGVQAEAARKRAPKNPDNKLNIINGRLPLPLVHMLRFQITGKTPAEKAKMFGTSVGKVFDIEKNRNFGYLTKDYKPSAEEVAAATAWCDTAKTFKGQTLQEAGGDPTAIKTMLTAMGVATPEEVAARGWQVRVVGQKAATGEAPAAPTAAPAATGATAAAPAEKPAGAKLF